jgi:hypothetical protein
MPELSGLPVWLVVVLAVVVAGVLLLMNVGWLLAVLKLNEEAARRRALRERERQRPQQGGERGPERPPSP